MNRMKGTVSIRFIAFLICGIMLISTNGIGVFAKETKNGETSMSWKTLKGLNLIDYNEDEQRDILSRGEFAIFLAKALKILPETEEPKTVNQFYEAFHGTVSPENNDASDEPKQVILSDVYSDSVEYESVKALVEYGIMCGDSDGKFYPDREIKYEEALKALVMTYSNKDIVERNGMVWPANYFTYANKAGITLRSKAIGSSVTKADIAEMYYKLLDVSMLSLEYIDANGAVLKYDKDKKFLNSVYGLYETDGQLTGTENSTLSEAYTTKNGRISIDEISYVNKYDEPLGSMLGRKVKGYYNEDDEIVFLMTTDDDDVSVIEADDIEGYSSGNLLYTERNSTKKINVNNYAVIYNGVVLTDYDSSIFEIEFGSITIIDSAKIKTVNIREYHNYVIGRIDNDRDIIYDKYVGKQFDLDEHSNTVYIYDETGSKTDVSKLTTNDIISVVDNQTYLEIHKEGNKITGKVTAMNSADNLVEVDGQEYKIPDSVKLMDKYQKIGLGSKITFYTDKNNKVFYIEDATSGEYEGGYLIASASEGAFDNVAKSKIYTAQAEFEVYEYAKKVTFVDKYNAEYKIKGTDIINKLDGYSGYCVYKLNGKNEITYVQIPLVSKKYLKPNDDKIYEKEIASQNELTYSAVQGNVGYTTFIDATTELYIVPNNTSDESRFKIQSADSFISDTRQFNATGYFKGDNPLAVAMIMNDEPQGIETANGIKLITDMSEQYDKDTGDLQICIEMKDGFGNDSAGIIKKDNNRLNYDEVETFVGGTKYKLSVGDFVYCDIDKNTKEVLNIKMVYSCNLKRNSSSSETGGLADVGFIESENRYSDQFFILDSVLQDYYNVSDSTDLMDYLESVSDIGDDRQQNPYAIYNFYNGWAKNPLTNTAGGMVMLGYAVHCDESFAFLTTQNLRYETYKSDCLPDNMEEKYLGPVKYSGIYFQRYYPLYTRYSKIWVVEYDRRQQVTIREGTPQDIQSYDVYGNDCSKILVSRNRHLFILNDYRNN